MLHFLDIRVKDGCEVIRLTHRRRSAPQTHYFLLMVLISVRDRVNPLRLEGLGKLKEKNSITSRIEPATFRLVA
jgi:hypothetical protein